MEQIKFGTIRGFISRIDRISVCKLEGLEYENFDHIALVPETYNDMYLYGIGMIESEFGDDIKNCIEIMVSTEPRVK